MAVDPNVYNLQVSLALETMQADQSLDQFGESLSELEDQISSSAQRAFGSIEKVISNMNVGLKDISSYATMGLDNMEAELKNMKKRAKFTDDLEDFLKVEVTHFDEMLEHLDKMIRFLKEKNELHESEGDMVGRESEQMEQLAERSNRNKKNVKDTEVSFREMARNAQRVIQALVDSDKAAERFHTTNWRAYGTQQLLAQEVRGLAMEYGILQSEAEEAMVVMGTMKVPRDQLVAYTKAVAEAVRYTGMSTQALGLYGRSLRQVSMDHVGFEKHMKNMAALMKAYKVDAETLHKAIQTTLSPATIDRMWGSGAAARYDKMKVAFAGLTEMAGRQADEFLDIVKAYEDPINQKRLEAFSGVMIRNEGDMAKALDSAASQATAMVEKMQRVRDAGGDTATELQILNSMAKSFGLPGGAQSLETLVALQKEAKKFGSGLGDLTNIVDKYNEMMADPTSEANRTLARQWDLLWTKIQSGIHYAWQPLRDAMMEVLLVVNTGLIKLGQWIKEFSAWWADIEKTSAFWGPVLKGIRTLYGYLGVLGLAFLAVGGAIAGFSIVTGGLVKVFQGAHAVIKLVSDAIITLAETIVKVVVVVFKGIADSLKYVLDAIKGNIGPLFALAGALVIVAAAAWVFAQAIAVLKDVDPTVIAVAAIALAGGLIALIAALAIVAAIGSVAWPILLAIGAAVLLAAAAMWVGAYAFKIFVEAMDAAVVVMKKLADKVLVDFAKALWDASLELFGASIMLGLTGAMMIMAGAAIATGSVMLIAGAAMATIAGGALFIAGIAISAAAVVISFGANALNTAATNIVTGAQMLLTGATFLLGGASQLLAGASVLLLAGIALGLAMIPLGAASLALLPVAAGVAVAGGAIGAASIALGWGARRLSKPAKSIAESSNILENAGSRLGIATSALASGIYALRRAIVLVKDIPTSSIGLVAEDAISMLPKLDQFSAGLTDAAKPLQTAVDTFSKPANELIAVLRNLGDAVAGFDVGDKLATDLDKLVTTLDAYATQLEGVSQRIEAAVESRALPAVRAAEEAGIQEAIRSEAVTSVEVIAPRESPGDQNTMRMATLLEQQNNILQGIVNIISGNTTSDHVVQIKELLERQLAASMPGDSELSSDLNKWS